MDKTPISIALAVIILVLAGHRRSVAESTVTMDKQGRRTQVATVAGRNGRHSFVVRLTSGPFREKNHKITGPKNDPRVDGKRAKGTDGGLPHEEFYTFEVTVDRTRWHIPKRLWADCYDPNLYTNPDHQTIWAVLSKDGQALAMGMRGSDGAGSYRVVWYLRKEGRHSREFRSPDEAWQPKSKPDMLRTSLAGVKLGDKNFIKFDPRAGYYLISHWQGRSRLTLVRLLLCPDPKHFGYDLTDPQPRDVAVFGSVRREGLPRLRTGRGVNIGDSLEQVRQKVGFPHEQYNSKAGIRLYAYRAKAVIPLKVEGSHQPKWDYRASYFFRQGRLWAIEYVAFDPHQRWIE